jgi:hypothetical protein
VPGCRRPAQTLDHRVPFSGGGTTSVINLFPMCNEHNESKGNTPYEVWIAIQRAIASVQLRRVYLQGGRRH